MDHSKFNIIGRKYSDYIRIVLIDIDEEFVSLLNIAIDHYQSMGKAFIKIIIIGIERLIEFINPINGDIIESLNLVGETNDTIRANTFKMADIIVSRSDKFLEEAKECGCVSLLVENDKHSETINKIMDLIDNPLGIAKLRKTF